LNDQDPPAPEFGGVALRGGWEVGELRDLHQVGPSARVTDVLPLPDGRCNLAATGERRFLVEQLDAGSRPYLVGTVRWLDEPDGPWSADLMFKTRRALRSYQEALSVLDVAALDPEQTDDISVDSLPRAGAADEEMARAVSYLVARQPWLPLADRQRLLASPDTAARLQEARTVLRRETELVSQLQAVPVTAAAFRN
ncbi:MAG TPA: LON peptidase substrate-binding domain-containing protein, partial [Jatrophihabitans sp.]|nr:LON peptidase substrate-binding domain-containing protein [Jatrophihabitans sp.]